MPSLFSRTRTASSPHLSGGADEFGMSHMPPPPPIPETPSKSKKNKKLSNNDMAQRQFSGGMYSVYGQSTDDHRASSAHGQGGGAGGTEMLPPLPDGSFLPLSFAPTSRLTMYAAPPQSQSPSSPSGLGLGGVGQGEEKKPEYSFYSYKSNVVLDPAALLRATTVLCDELTHRGGLTAPFLFESARAGGMESGVGKGMGRVRRVIDAFLETCRYQGGGGAGTREQKVKEEKEREWREEVRFSGMYELGVVLRWALARPVRLSVRSGSVQTGEVRGLVDWERYEEWKDPASYPPNHFPSLLSPAPPVNSPLQPGSALVPNTYPPLDKDIQRTLLTLLSLLTRLIAHSKESGHTPPSLASLFGPLIFGLGGTLFSFPATYQAYLRSVHAAEHLILSFIRWQDSPHSSLAPTSPGGVGFDGMSSTAGGGFGFGVASGAGGSARSLGVPTRLKEWIKSYPAGLHVFSRDTNRALRQSRPGVRTVRVTTVRRNVRAYSGDLVKTSASWAKWQEPVSLSSLSSSTSTSKKDKKALGASAEMTMISAPGMGSGVLGKSREWGRVCPPSRGGGGGDEREKVMPPRYAESYKRRMNLPRGQEPEWGVRGGAGSVASSLSSSTYSTDDSLFSSVGSGSLSRENSGSRATTTSESGHQGGGEEFESLSDLKWGTFESFGFSGGEEETRKKLAFDLTEGARQARKEKRATLTWNDFSADGFSRGDGDLRDTLGFSTPLVNQVSAWPQQRDEMGRKLKKTHKALPPFGWSTEPVLGGEEVVEEGFLDVFCELVYGGGWMERERERSGEEGWLERECSWALVEFKAEPHPKPAMSSSASYGADPRTSASTFLFEEFVPLEYRQQLLSSLGHHGGGSKRPRLGSLFSSSPNTGGKEWKQAATLNGRPYVLGSTPVPGRAMSMARKEMEFEALLRAGDGGGGVGGDGGGKTMSMSDLTRTGPMERGVPADESMLPSPEKEKKKKGMFKIGGGGGGEKDRDKENKEKEREREKEEEKERKRKESEKEKVLPKKAAPVGMDRKDLQPAVYESVEFETRLAEAAEGVVDAGAGAGRKRHKKGGGGGDGGSMDDAWVDILVNSQGRRIEGQDVLPGAGRRMENPDEVNREVQRALEGVRGYEDEDVDVEIQRVPRTPREDDRETLEYMSERGGYRDSDMYTEGEVYDEDEEYGDEDEDEDMRRSREVRARARDLRRGGGSYFDKHPERRPASMRSEGMGTASYTETEVTDDDEGEDGDLGPYGGRHREEEEEGDGETTPVRETPPGPPPGAARPAIPGSAGQLSNGNGAAKGTGTGSKTAALIEMYRERENSNSTSPRPVQASKIPVRGSSLDAAGAGASGAGPGSPAGPRAPKSPTSPSPISSPQAQRPGASDLDPPKPVVDTPPRDQPSPARYVHGAPLHNVTEEEEEE